MFKKIIIVLALSSFLAPLYCMEQSFYSIKPDSKNEQNELSVEQCINEIMKVLSTLHTKGSFFNKHKEVTQCFHDEKNIGGLVALEQLLSKAEAKKALQAHLSKLDIVLLDSFLLGAARADCPELIKMLNAAGAHVDARDEESHDTAVMYTATFSSLKALEVLINAGADVNAADTDGTTPIILASSRWKDALALVNLLIQAKANVNALKVKGSEFNALMYAITFPKVNVVDALLKAGANPYVETSKGMTPLLIAVMNSNLPIITSLLNTPTDAPAHTRIEHIKAALEYVLKSYAMRTTRQDIVEVLEKALHALELASN
jgi:hypothetical protein